MTVRVHSLENMADVRPTLKSFCLPVMFFSRFHIDGFDSGILNRPKQQQQHTLKQNTPGVDTKLSLYGWLVGGLEVWNMHFIFPFSHILGILSNHLTFSFFRGVAKNIEKPPSSWGESPFGHWSRQALPPRYLRPRIFSGHGKNLPSGNLNG